jgi:hypothetical protein
MSHDQETAGLIGGVVFILAALLIIALVLTGCAIPVQHSLNIPLPKPTPTCQKLMPIPTRMLIDIDGPAVTADIDGERFLRAYVSTRDCLRAAK